MIEWHVWNLDQGESYRINLQAATAEAAAIAWATSRVNKGNLDTSTPPPLTVCVRGPATENAEQRFVVYGVIYSVTRYHARQTQ
jgi:hypothetical protein